ncbi:hypothetical protein M405DRAFT_891923 [Rhizopogon salebrosus TDB-379]|nr:hypothetical protein M405DRAFT_891923 [Rhizopogon salebrosus TDB-379]
MATLYSMGPPDGPSGRMMEKDIRTNFMVMINFMTLVCKSQSIHPKTGLSLKGIYEDEFQNCPAETHITYHTFLEWHASGMLIAGLGLRVSISSMVGTTHLHLADMLRSPPKDSPESKLILEHIVPTIARMRITHPLSMVTISFMPLARSRRIWRACIVSMPRGICRFPLQKINYDELQGASRPYSPPLSDVNEDVILHIVIKTLYDPLLPENKRFKPPHDKAKNTIWSASERSRAEAGERVKSIEDLCNKIIPNHHLELRNRDGSLMAFVSTGLPSHIRSLLEVNLLATFENADLLGEMNTRVLGAGPRRWGSTFPGHAPVLGHDAPTEVQPWLLEKEGMQTNHGQVIPYISWDLQQHQHIYNTISRVYEELFEWVRGLMENYLQEEFETLMEVVSVLPGNAVLPLIGTAMIDIYVWSYLLGGALCLLENGLVLELHNGDIALFKSSEVMHFNLDYQGARASLVFQTDKEFVAWLKNHNGWVDNRGSQTCRFTCRF